MSERRITRPPNAPTFLQSYYDEYNFAIGSKERMAYNPEGLEIVLGLQNLDGGQVGKALLDRMMKKEDGKAVLQIDLLFLWGMVGTGKSLIASQLEHEVVKQTEGRKKVRVVEIDEAVLITEITHGSRDTWGDEARHMMGVYFQGLITDSQDNGDFTIAVAPAVGDETTRQRGASVMRSLAEEPDRRLFVGSYLDPRVQDDSAALRGIVPTIPVEEVEDWLRERKHFFHGVGEHSLFEQLQPHERGQVIQYLYKASARPTHIDLLNGEIDRLGVAALAQNPDVKIPTALQQLTGEELERVRRATAYLENHSRNDLKLRHAREGNRMLVMNPYRPDIPIRHFIDDRRVSLAMGYPLF